jgi:Arc-like DNA binding domain
MDCPISSFWITGQMAKRKRTDVVKLQLRIREALRRRLEAAAKTEERSLNSEIAHRLEHSFEQEKNSLLLEELLAPGAGLELIRAVAIILRTAGRDWIPRTLAEMATTPPKYQAVSEAITKFIAVQSGQIEPIEESFPNRNERGSADALAWPAVHVGQWQSLIDHIGRGGT